MVIGAVSSFILDHRLRLIDFPEIQSVCLQIPLGKLVILCTLGDESNYKESELHEKGALISAVNESFEESTSLSENRHMQSIHSTHNICIITSLPTASRGNCSLMAFPERYTEISPPIAYIPNKKPQSRRVATMF